MKIVISALILIVFGCAGELKKDKKGNLESTESYFSEQTTDNLCQVANYLKNKDFNGDFYIYEGEIKWGMSVDSIRIPNEIINLLLTEKIEYIACSQGIFEFGFHPNNNEERGLILNSKPINPLITSGNVKPKYKKLTNSKCLNFDWYYQTYK